MDKRLNSLLYIFAYGFALGFSLMASLLVLFVFSRMGYPADGMVYGQVIGLAIGLFFIVKIKPICTSDDDI